MNLKVFGAALLRRWYFTVLAVVLAVGLGGAVAMVTGAKYSVVATSVLIPPRSTVDNAAKTANYAPPNPLLYLGGLAQARDVVLRALGSEDIGEAVKDKAPGATVEVTNDPQSSGPLIIITTEAKTEAAALAALDVMKSQGPLALSAIQQQLGIAQDNRITVFELTSDASAKANRKSQIQLAVVVGAAVLLLGLLALAIVDGARSGLQLRRGGSARTVRCEEDPVGLSAMAGGEAPSTVSSTSEAGPEQAPNGPNRVVIRVTG